MLIGVLSYETTSSSWQNVVLETPFVAGTNTDALLITLPDVSECLSVHRLRQCDSVTTVQDTVMKTLQVCGWDQSEGNV